MNDTTIKKIADLMVHCQLSDQRKAVTVLAVLADALRDGWDGELAELVREHHKGRKEKR